MKEYDELSGKIIGYAIEIRFIHFFPFVSLW
jgi:hypothetical protein